MTELHLRWQRSLGNVAFGLPTPGDREKNRTVNRELGDD